MFGKISSMLLTYMYAQKASLTSKVLNAIKSEINEYISNPEILNLTALDDSTKERSEYDIIKDYESIKNLCISLIETGIINSRFDTINLGSPISMESATARAVSNIFPKALSPKYEGVGLLLPDT